MQVSHRGLGRRQADPSFSAHSVNSVARTVSGTIYRLSANSLAIQSPC